MLHKMIHQIGELRSPAKTVILIGVGAALPLMSAACFFTFTGSAPLALQYLSERMAKTATTLFSEGVVLGFLFEIFLTMLDRNRK